MLKLSLKPNKAQASKGDTIVEVLISVTILSMVLVVAFVSTSRSLQQGTGANNRQTATSYAQQQIEIIKNSVSTSPQALSKYQSSTAFCIDPSKANSAEDNYGYNAATSSFCQNIGGKFSISNSYSGGLFTVHPTWQGATSQDQLSIYYKVPVGGSGSSVAVTINYTVYSHPALRVGPTLTILADNSVVVPAHSFSLAELPDSCPTDAYGDAYQPQEVCHNFTQTFRLAAIPRILEFQLSGDNDGFSLGPGCGVDIPPCHEDNNIELYDVSIPGYQAIFGTLPDASPSESVGPGEPPVPTPNSPVGPSKVPINWNGIVTLNIQPS